VVAGAVRAGGTLRREPADTFWGGYAGSFADPDSHIGEIACNPFFTLDESGIRVSGSMYRQNRTYLHHALPLRRQSSR
jgi:hypothetical protein